MEKPIKNKSTNKKKTKALKIMSAVALGLVGVLLIMFISIIFVPHYATKDGICVLAYHGVVSDEEKATKYKDHIYTISVSQFESHMKYLSENGYTTYFMDEIEQYMDGEIDVPEKAVALTFDDGLKNFNTVVKPILEKYNLKGTCFVIGKHLTSDNKSMLKTEDIVNTENVQYFSHSHNLHYGSGKGINRKIIQELSYDELMADFNMDYIDDTYFAFPYGRRADGIDKVLKDAGVVLAFDYNHFKHVTRESDRYALSRYMMLSITPECYFRWIVR